MLSRCELELFTDTFEDGIDALSKVGLGISDYGHSGNVSNMRIFKEQNWLDPQTKGAEQPAQPLRFGVCHSGKHLSQTLIHKSLQEA